MSMPVNKFTFNEGCDKLKDQYNVLLIQFANLKNESDKLRNEKSTVTRHYGFYYEVSCALNCELHRYLEGLKRINMACNNMIPNLSAEQHPQMNQIIDFIRQLTNNDAYITSMPNGDSAVRTPHPTNGSVVDNFPESVTASNPNLTNEIPPAEENMYDGDHKIKSADQLHSSKKFPQDSVNTINNEMNLSLANSEGVHEISSKSLNNLHSSENHSHSTAAAKRDIAAAYSNVIIPNPPPSGYMGHFPPPPYNGDMHPQSLPIQGGAPHMPPSLPVNPAALHPRSPSNIPTMGFGMGGFHPGPPITNLPMGSRVVGNSYDVMRYGGPGAPYRHPFTSYPGVGAVHPAAVTAPNNSMGHSRISQSQKTSPLPNEYNLPKAFSEVAVLPHGDVVCTVTTTNDRLAITGGKGSVKIWDIGKNSPNVELVGTVDCLVDKYIRSCKTTPDRKVVVAGESNHITLFDLGLVKKTQSLLGPKNLTQLETNTNACYALALSPDGRLCYGGCSNGFVTIWDIVSNKIVRAFYAHTDGISCLDISPDGNKLYTGSLDRSAKAWDLRDNKLLEHYTYNAQVYAIACVPNNDWICAGLENSLIDVTSRSNERFELELHKSSVLSLQVAPTYDWMISVGKDNIVNCIRTPYGPPIYQILEEGSVLCCDISPDSNWVITGSSDRKATIYELQY